MALSGDELVLEVNFLSTLRNFLDVGLFVISPHGMEGLFFSFSCWFFRGLNFLGVLFVPDTTLRHSKKKC